MSSTLGPAGELLVRFRGVEERPARVCTLPDGELALDDRLDLAVLEILDVPGDAPAVAVARLRDNPTLDVPNLDGCVAFGVLLLSRVRGHAARVPGRLPGKRRARAGSRR